MKKTKSDYQEIGLRALETQGFRGSVIMPTGLGKSRLLVESAKRIHADNGHAPLKILYLCNSTLLRDTGFKEELHKWGGTHLLQYMEFKCYQSAYKLFDLHYDIVLADEADFALSDEYIKFFNENSYQHLVAVSATIDDHRKALLEQIAPVVYEVTLREAEESGALNSTKFFRVPFLMYPEEIQEYDKLTERIARYMSMNRTPTVEFQLQQTLLARKQLMNTLQSSRDTAIRLLHKLETREDLKILLFCEQVSQVTQITEHTFHGGTPKGSNILEEFNEGRFQTLGVCDRINRGINLNRVNCIIVESCGRSVTKVTQRLGRGKRLDVTDVLRAFFLLPYRTTADTHKLKPTVAHDWLQQALHKNIKVSDMEPISI